MATREELDQKSSKELHDMAVHHARRHLDVASSGADRGAARGRGGARVTSTPPTPTSSRAWLIFNDITDSGKGETAELLRPLYIDYLADD